MIEYNYNFEIMSNLAFFESAFDDTIIKRYRRNNADPKELPVAEDSIKINYKYGPKSRILEDLRGQPDTIKFPIVAITMTGQGRDNDRQKTKEPITYKDVTGALVTLYAIPWNINVAMHVLAKYQEDVDQIIGNFAVLCNPYIIFSWREPKSGRDIRSQVLWDGNISYDYPTVNGDLANDAVFRLSATTNFTIKTYLYRTAIENEKPICKVNFEVVAVDQFYCKSAERIESTANNTTDRFSILGRPQLRYVDNYYFQTGQTPTINLQGDGFNGTFALFVSGSNPDMYPLSRYNPISGSDISFNGYAVSEFNIHNSQSMTFTIPAPSAFGFCDLIAVNNCGYGQLTIDANRCNREVNPYPISVPEHYSWCVNQFPFLNGLVVTNNLNNGSTIDYSLPIIVIDENTIDRDAILQKIKELMELGDISIDEL